MKYKDLAALKPAELEKKASEARMELVKLRAQVATGTAPKNPAQLKQYRKIIARIETLRSARARDATLSKKNTEDKQQDA